MAWHPGQHLVHRPSRLDAWRKAGAANFDHVDQISVNPDIVPKVCRR
jgi:hypothetical protein